MASKREQNPIDKRNEQNRVFNNGNGFSDKPLNVVFDVEKQLNDFIMLHSRPVTRNTFFDLESDKDDRKKTTGQNNEEDYYQKINQTNNEQSGGGTIDYNDTFFNDQAKIDEQLREEQQRIDEENKRVNESFYNEQYKMVGTGMGMQKDTGANPFNMYKDMMRTAAGADVLDNIFNKDIEKQLERVKAQEEAQRKAIEDENYQRVEEQKKEIQERNNKYWGSGSDMPNASSGYQGTTSHYTATVGTAALNIGGVAYAAGNTSPGAAPQFNADNTGSQQRINQGYAGSQNAQMIEGTRSRQMAVRNMANDAIMNTKDFVARQAYDISDAHEGEFANERSKAKSMSKTYGTPAVNIARVQLARMYASNGRFDYVDNVLGRSDSKYAQELARAKTSKDFKDIEQQIGIEARKKFGTDVSSLNTKELSDFAKQGLEQKQIADAVSGLRRAQTLAPVSGANLMNMGKGTMQLVNASFLVPAQRGEAFDGFSELYGKMYAVKMFANKTEAMINNALTKRATLMQQGRNAAANGMSPGFGATGTGRRTGTRGYYKANKWAKRGFLGTNKESALREELAQQHVGHIRQVRNMYGKGLKERARLGAESFSKIMQRGIKTGTKAGARTAFGAAGLKGLFGVSTSGGAAGFLKPVGVTLIQKGSVGLSAKIAASALGKTAFGQGLAAAIEALGGPVAWIITIIVVILALCGCFSCASGVNDLFSTTSAFNTKLDGTPTNDPNESYAAETIVLLDAYLNRNYEFICKRGLENIIEDNMKGDTTKTMSATAPFTVDFSSGANIEYESDVNSSDDDPVSATAATAKKSLKFDAGKVSVIKHQAEEKISSAGEDMSTPKRFVIGYINGTVAPYQQNGNDIKIDTSKAKNLLNNTHPKLIERYVYDVESRNSIFYTDIDHYILPDIDNVINIKNTKMTGQKDGKGDELYSDHTSSGERTPFDNAVFDNTKEIISMAIAGFSNDFVMDPTGRGSFKKGVTPKQFQAYCYGLWLQSHYITCDDYEESSGTRTKNTWSTNLKNFITGGDTTVTMQKQLEDHVKDYYLTNIRSFGGAPTNQSSLGVKKNATTGAVNDEDVNIVTPFNTLIYSPELNHYGLYYLNGSNLMVEEDLGYNLHDTAEGKRHKPASISSSSESRTQNISSVGFKGSNGPASYFNVNNSTQARILAAKLPILNISDSAAKKAMFGNDVFGNSVANMIKTAKTHNYRYFSEKTTLVKESSSPEATTNGNSFIYTDEKWYDLSDAGATVAETSFSGKDEYWENWPSFGEPLILKERKRVGEGVTAVDGYSNDQVKKKILEKLDLDINSIETNSKVVALADKIYDEEECIDKMFYKAFATNTGVDESASAPYKYPKYVNDKSGSKGSFSWNTTLMTNCGTQEAYSGSTLLSAVSIDPDKKFGTKGRRDILMNVLEDTNKREKFITKRNSTTIPADFNKIYFTSMGTYDDIRNDIASKGLNNSVLVKFAPEVGDLHGVTIVAVYQSDTIDSLAKAKELVQPYHRVLLVYIESTDSSPSSYDKVRRYTCDCEHGDECDDCDYDEEDGDDCNCEEDGIHDCCDILEEGYVTDFKATIAFHEPIAEFCGFYLCGGHTQIALMPVILTMTGSKTLFDCDMGDIKTLNDYGIQSNSFIGQNVDNLNAIWQITPAAGTGGAGGTSGTGGTTSLPGYAAVAKQNRINAVEGISDSWEDKYGIKYNTLRSSTAIKSSDTIAKDLDAKSNAGYGKGNKEQPFYAYKPSNLRATRTYAAGDLANKYKITSAVKGITADPSAQYIQTEDMQKILNMVRKEMLAKGVNENADPIAGQKVNEYASRLERVTRALSMVGKVGYSQANHQWSTVTPVKDYNELIYKTDCSGFASWLLGYGLSPGFNSMGEYIPSTKGIFTTKNRNTLNAEYSQTTYAGLKPGDLAFKEGHVIMYVGTGVNLEAPDGNIYYVDCTSVGGKLGPGGVQFAGMESSKWLSKYTKGFYSIPYDYYPDISKDERITFN